MKRYLLVFVLLYTCEQDNTSLLPSSSGNLNVISVVLNDELWEGSVGKALKDDFSKPIYGLPQREQMFSLKHIPIRVFSGFVTKSRTIIKVQKANISKTSVEYNKYATPQTVIQFSGPSSKEILKLIKRDANSLIDLINKREIAEKQRRIKKSLSKNLEVKNNLNINIKYPSVYRLAKSTDDFVWIRKDIKSGHLNLMIYEVSNKDLLNRTYNQIRDSISKLHIPGPVEGTRMGIDDGYIIGIKEGVLKNRMYTEYRGLWEVKDQFMAGPFIGYKFDDKKNNRQVYVDGFVYAPSANKRSYIFELESIIKSIIID
jgi:hypothetical protein